MHAPPNGDGVGIAAICRMRALQGIGEGKMALTLRDVAVAVVAASATLCAVVVADPVSSVMQSSAFEWKTVPSKPTEVGALRQFFRAPTATLDELELHVTTLNPGLSSHP